MTKSAAPVSTGTRKSSRVASKPQSAATGEKRGAEDKPKSAPASKKVKAAVKDTKEPASKPAPKPASKPASTKAKVSSKAAEAPAPKPSKPASKAAAVEKALEAPASAPSSKGLKLGDKLPKLTLQDNTGSDVDVSTLAGEKGVVIFLYPKADTPGCTNQACGFRDHFADIQKLGYDVYGLSKDKPAAQQRWIDKKELNYKLLCDPESKLIKKLGAFVQPNNTKRSHFIFEKGSGKLVDAQLGVKPADDPSNCLKFIEKHHK